MLIKKIKPNKVVWRRPDRLTIELDEDNIVESELYKGALEDIHKTLGFKIPTSKDVYKLNHDIWNELRDYTISELENNTNKKFDLNNIYYLMDDSYNVVDVTTFDNLEDEVKFDECLKKYTADITTFERTRKFYSDCKDGTVKLVCYDSNDDITTKDYVPVVILEFNTEKAVYKVYTGILVYTNFTFIPNVGTYGEYNNIKSVILHLDISKVLQFAKESALDLYNQYLEFVKDNEEISVRELMRLLDKFGYKLQLNTSDNIDDISNITDETAVKEIQDFFNTFSIVTGETALDVIKLPELQKIFKYNNLTFVQLLHILSKEYLTFEGSKIRMDDIINIVFKLFSKSTDTNNVDSIKRVIK